jgi:predicted RNase H-like nuclease (RuvC/YqgF family)
MSAVLEDEVMDEARLKRLESDVAHIRVDISDLKTDGRQIRSEFGSLNARVAALQDEMHVSDGKLRDEIRTSHDTLRLEMRTSNDALRLEMHTWMLSVAGTLLAVMAQGFKWL